jgi:3-phenylpropionate/trans-cinnamate dioxygenase ferredoxin component
VSGWRRVEVPEDAVEGRLVAARVAGYPLVLVRSGGSWHALADECTHTGCAFSEDGELVDGVLSCNCHGAEFALETGAVIEGPADGPLETYAVRVVEGAVEVLVESRCQT